MNKTKFILFDQNKRDTKFKTLLNDAHTQRVFLLTDQEADHFIVS